MMDEFYSKEAANCYDIMFNFLYTHTHKHTHTKYKLFKVTSKSHDFDHSSIIFIMIDDSPLLFS